MTDHSTQIAIIGTGIIGISTAYYLSKNHNINNIILIDAGQPMAFTSAQSGENYRNWWPHPTMVEFTNRSIDLIEEISRESGNRPHMNRRGYALATRETNIDELIEQMRVGYGEKADELIRIRGKGNLDSYAPPLKPDWELAPDGADIIKDKNLIQKTFPSFEKDIETVLHIRRGGDISGQQMGQFMLEYLKEKGVRRIIGMVKDIAMQDGYVIELSTSNGIDTIKADTLVNAAGPFADKIAKMIDVDLPVYNSFQQKIAFEDVKNAIPREMPFVIDLDGQIIDWSNEEKELLGEEESLKWLLEKMPGCIHCRPDGGDHGSWIKLGWAYNEDAADATWEPPLYDQFPEIVLRGASRLNPSLKAYYGHFPRNMTHYGGWYTMTEENWPLIGPMDKENSYIVSALSGFGTMASCASGELAAAWITGSELPSYGSILSMERYKDDDLMKSLREGNKGVL